MTTTKPTTNTNAQNSQPVYQAPKNRVNNFIWLLIIIPIISWIIPIYYMIIAINLKSELQVRKVKRIEPLNHFVWLWIIPIITLIVPFIYYCIRANQYNTAIKMMEFNK